MFHLKINFFCFWVIIVQCRPIAIESPHSQWIVWNVGQGQWITHIHHQYCWHFDFGGEKDVIRKVQDHCSWRENRLILSHPDKDHYVFIKSILSRLKNVCLWGPSWKKLTHRIFRGPPPPFCNSHHTLTPHFFLPHGKRGDDDNLSSQMASWKGWLIPGDAPQKRERQWVAEKRKNSLITHLVLGHHGSKTSTSSELLNALSQLRQCIASSRIKKYGHPHRDVRNRIKKHCPLVLTEDWGHLHYLEGW